MAEVLVKPEDIAAVKVNDKAEIKVTAYDFSKYGKIKGEVAFISPGTMEHRRQALLLQGSDQLQTGPVGQVRRGMAAAARHDGRCRNHLRQQVAAAVHAEADLSRHRRRLLRALSKALRFSVSRS